MNYKNGKLIILNVENKTLRDLSISFNLVKVAYYNLPSVRFLAFDDSENCLICDLMISTISSIYLVKWK